MDILRLWPFAYWMWYDLFLSSTIFCSFFWIPVKKNIYIYICTIVRHHEMLPWSSCNDCTFSQNVFVSIIKHQLLCTQKCCDATGRTSAVACANIVLTCCTFRNTTNAYKHDTKAGSSFAVHYKCLYFCYSTLVSDSANKVISWLEYAIC